MKKRVFLIILSAFCVSVSACQNGQSQDVVSGDDLSIQQGGEEVKDGTSMDDIMIPDEEFYGQGITISDRTQENFIIINEDDADVIRDLFMDESRYVQTAPNCLMDCFLNVDGVEIQYHSDCGNLMRFDNGMSMKLTEEEKNQVNDIFGKYISLGFGASVDENKVEDIGDGSVDPQNNEVPEAESVVDSSWGLTLSVENVTSEGLTLIFKRDGSNSEKELLTGRPFVLERYYTGGWVAVEPVPVIDDDITWTMEAWLIPAESKGEFPVDWSYIYGSLEAGKYRIGKDITYFSETEKSQNERYYAEFEIPDKSTEISKKWGVYLNVARCSADGMLLYCTQLGPTLGKSVNFDGRTYSAMTVGMEYWLEKFEKDSWVKLPYLTEDTVPTWSQMFEMIELDTTMSWNIEWRDLYGHLPEGQYRIGKKITGKLDDGEYEAFNIYSVFEISSPVYSAEDWGISAEVSEVSNNSISFVIRQDGGSVWQELEMNEVSMNLEGFRFSETDYYIEKFNGSYWIYLEPLNSKPQIIAGVGKYSVLELSESLGFTVDWSERYGALPVGQYRLVKEFSVKDNSFSQINVPVYIDFEVK